jgi:hypothetical protein
MVAHFPFHLRELLGHQATYIITMAMRKHRAPDAHAVLMRKQLSPLMVGSSIVSRTGLPI